MVNVEDGGKSKILGGSTYIVGLSLGNVAVMVLAKNVVSRNINAIKMKIFLLDISPSPLLLFVATVVLKVSSSKEKLVLIKVIKI